MGASAEPQTNTGELNNSGYDIDPSYVPNDDEPFMNDRQLRYFEKQLVDWKNSILAESQGTLNQLQDGPMREPDLNDRASSETDWGIELRTRDRQRKLISKRRRRKKRKMLFGAKNWTTLLCGDYISTFGPYIQPIHKFFYDDNKRIHLHDRIHNTVSILNLILLLHIITFYFLV